MALLRFVLVGVANTAVYYALYLSILPFLPYVVAHLIAWTLSFLFSFFVNCYYTFRVRPTWGRLLRFPLSSIVNVGLTTFGTIFLVEVWRFDERLAPLVMGILAVPATFLVARLALADRQPSRQESAEAL